MKPRMPHLTKLALLALFTFASIGCGGIPIRIVEPDSDAQSTSLSADDAIAGATAAIKAGDLEEASELITAAEGASPNEHQQMQIRSLASLLAGGNAMMNGDAEAASAHWHSIEDTNLRNQVLNQARARQFSIPAKIANAQP
jgi:hypothetical protein